MDTYYPGALLAERTATATAARRALADSAAEFPEISLAICDHPLRSAPRIS